MRKGLHSAPWLRYVKVIRMSKVTEGQLIKSLPDQIALYRNNVRQHKNTPQILHFDGSEL
jgi:hypothetical protein